MTRLFPKALAAGDEIAVLAPASGGAKAEAIQCGLDRFREWGFVPTWMPHARGRLDWPDGCAVAATDVERHQDLQEAIRNPRYRAIVAVRGGYGVTRLLAGLDLTPLTLDPKPILGYSDLTALLAAAHAETGVIGFHGPMLATSPSMDAGFDGWAMQRELLTATKQPLALPRVEGTRGLCTGTAEGPLVGGNLSLVQCLIGTRWEIDTRGAILFLEDTGEAPYRVDRILTHLHQTGALARAAGVILGDFHVAGTPLGSTQPSMLAVFEERLGSLGIPVAYGFPIGHMPGSWTLPYGVRARVHVPVLDGPATLELLEPAVHP